MIKHYCDRCNREIKNCDGKCKITFTWCGSRIPIESIPPTEEICDECLKEFLEWYKKGKNYGR